MVAIIFGTIYGDMFWIVFFDRKLDVRVSAYTEDIDKIRDFGITGHLGKWLANFLSDRTQQEGSAMTVLL